MIWRVLGLAGLLLLGGSLPGWSFTLQILHGSDFEAGITAIEDIPRFSSVVEGLKADYPSNTVVLSSGDNYIVGPFMTAAADPAAGFNGIKGRGDIAILNAIGIQASAFGNHEYDDGTATIRSLLRSDSAVEYEGTAFPYLSANLVFTNDSNLKTQVVEDGQDAAGLANCIARSCTIPVGGETIGVVGATTPELASLSSPGTGVGILTNIEVEVQAAVDALTNAGINKVVLLAHLQQVEYEIALAGRLRGVDVIIAGGSHALMAKEGDRLRTGDERYGDYPVAVVDRDGQPVYVINTDSNYRYVGRFVVDFGVNGILTNVAGLSGAYATDEQGVQDTGNHPPAAGVTGIVATLAGIIDAKDGNISGRTDVYLNGIRESVRTEETNLGDLTADANRGLGRQVDPAVSISLKNSGGIRDSIGAILSAGGAAVRVPPLANPRVGKSDGDISQLDIENALRFNNALALVTVTAQQLRDTMEWGVAGKGTPGQFPQVSGLKFSFDPARAAMTNGYVDGVPIQILYPGERLRSLVALRDDGRQDLVVEDGALVGDSNRTFRIITLAFLAEGGDGYFALTQGIARTNLVAEGEPITYETIGAEQRALADYLAERGTCGMGDVAAAEDERIQRLNARGDGVLQPELTGVAGAGTTLQVAFRTLPGKAYVAESASTADGEWEMLAVPACEEGDGDEQLVSFPISATTRYYRIRRVVP